MVTIKERRETIRVEFSQHHLAHLTGIPQSRISLIERGLVTPKPAEQAKIAEALRCTVAELWGAPNEDEGHA